MRFTCLSSLRVVLVFENRSLRYVYLIKCIPIWGEKEGGGGGFV